MATEKASFGLCKKKTHDVGIKSPLGGGYLPTENSQKAQHPIPFRISSDFRLVFFCKLTSRKFEHKIPRKNRNEILNKCMEI